MVKLKRLNPHKNRTAFKDKVFYSVSRPESDARTSGVWYFSHAPTIRDFMNLDPDYDPDSSVGDAMFSISELTFRS